MMEKGALLHRRNVVAQCVDLPQLSYQCIVALVLQRFPFPWGLILTHKSAKRGCCAFASNSSCSLLTGKPLCDSWWVLWKKSSGRGLREMESVSTDFFRKIASRFQPLAGVARQREIVGEDHPRREGGKRLSSLLKKGPRSRALDSRFRGNDEKRNVFPSRHPRESGDPGERPLFQQPVRSPHRLKWHDLLVPPRQLPRDLRPARKALGVVFAGMCVFQEHLNHTALGDIQCMLDVLANPFLVESSRDV